MKYEYNAINNPTFLGDMLLNRLGDQGWELVSHAYNSNTCDHFYTFKREKISYPRGIANTLTPQPNLTEKPILWCGKHQIPCNEDKLCPKCLEENNK